MNPCLRFDSQYEYLLQMYRQSNPLLHPQHRINIHQGMHRLVYKISRIMHPPPPHSICQLQSQSAYKQHDQYNTKSMFFMQLLYFRTQSETRSVKIKFRKCYANLYINLNIYFYLNHTNVILHSHGCVNIFMHRHQISLIF